MVLKKRSQPKQAVENFDIKIKYILILLFYFLKESDFILEMEKIRQRLNKNKKNKLNLVSVKGKYYIFQNYNTN